jgi:hypothetical protein
MEKIFSLTLLFILICLNVEANTRANNKSYIHDEKLSTKWISKRITSYDVYDEDDEEYEEDDDGVKEFNRKFNEVIYEWLVKVQAEVSRTQIDLNECQKKLSQMTSLKEMGQS